MSRKQSKTTHTSRGHGVPWLQNFSCGLLSTFYSLENCYRACLKTSYRCQNKNSHPLAGGRESGQGGRQFRTPYRRFLAGGMGGNIFENSGIDTRSLLMADAYFGFRISLVHSRGSLEQS